MKNKGLILTAFFAGVYLSFRGIKRLTTNDQEQIDILARTAWGEARGEGTRGMQAVINVIMNRVKRGGWYGLTPKEVCLKKWQFSVWNDNDPNRAKILAVTEADEKFATALYLADLAYFDRLEDITAGATEYHTVYITPDWSWNKLTKVATIGSHVFYRSVA